MMDMQPSYWTVAVADNGTVATIGQYWTVQAAAAEAQHLAWLDPYRRYGLVKAYTECGARCLAEEGDQFLPVD
jgi:hypothetical protein